MKRWLTYIVFISHCLGSLTLAAQSWPKVLLPNIPIAPWSLAESYDKGYIIGGMFTPHGPADWGIIIKTDVNGNVLWYKSIGQFGDGTGVLDINPTTDGGYIMTGGTRMLHPDDIGDTWIEKLNACGETEWCRIYSTANQFGDYGIGIHQVPGGYVALVGGYGFDVVDQRIWLFKLDNDGDIVWQYYYGQTDTLIENEWPHDMIVSTGGDLIITGLCYFPEPGQNYFWIRPFIIQVDSNGIVEWERPWRNNQQFIGWDYRSIVDLHGTIYTAAVHSDYSPPPGNRPCLLKTNKYGLEIDYFDLFDTVPAGGLSTINWLMDSNIVSSGGGGYIGNIPAFYAFKTDRNGNLLISKFLLEDINGNGFQDGTSTFNNKVVLTGGFTPNNYFNTFLYKLRSDLEFDSIYTTPFVYDSLCPYPIVSDTLPLDCVIVGLDEIMKDKEKSEFKVYPNPASDILHIVIPDLIRIDQSTQTYTAGTIYHQWESVGIEIYNITGRLIITEEGIKSMKQVDLDVSEWESGLYFVQVKYLGRVVGNEKIMVRH